MLVSIVNVPCLMHSHMRQIVAMGDNVPRRERHLPR
jgi:hypothetical protein